MTAVGSSEPQPDSTSATPRPSPGRFWMQTWGRSRVGGRKVRRGLSRGRATFRGNVGGASPRESRT